HWPEEHKARGRGPEDTVASGFVAVRDGSTKIEPGEYKIFLGDKGGQHEPRGQVLGAVIVGRVLATAIHDGQLIVEESSSHSSMDHKADISAWIYGAQTDRRALNQIGVAFGEQRFVTKGDFVLTNLHIGLREIGQVKVGFTQDRTGGGKLRLDLVLE